MAVILLAGCNAKQLPEELPTQKVFTNPAKAGLVKATTPPPASYKWTTAAQGPGCLRQVRAMMQWYGADSLHNFHFITHATGKGAQNYYLLNQKEVDRYLNSLRNSGYFSKKFILVQQNNFQTLQRNFLRIKQTDNEPEGLEGDRIFPVSDFADMMELKNSFSFSIREKENVVLIDTGEAIQQISFTGGCEINKIVWLSRSPKAD